MFCSVRRQFSSTASWPTINSSLSAVRKQFMMPPSQLVGWCTVDRFGLFIIYSSTLQCENACQPSRQILVVSWFSAPVFAWVRYRFFHVLALPHFIVVSCVELLYGFALFLQPVTQFYCFDPCYLTLSLNISELQENYLIT
jgi:hypothetical protein